MVNLTDYACNTISVAIDMVNVYVVAYCVGDQYSYFLQDIPTATTTLFPGTTRNQLRYTSEYSDLETARGRSRETIYLGIPELATAVSNLWYHGSDPVALIVIIQMVSEANRFGYIESQVVRSDSCHGRVIRNQQYLFPIFLLLS